MVGTPGDRSEHGAREYRQHMAAIHEEVVRTGKPAVVTKDGQPHVEVVPAGRGHEASLIERWVAEGLVDRASVPSRPPITPVTGGGADSVEILAESRR